MLKKNKDKNRIALCPLYFLGIFSFLVNKRSSPCLGPTFPDVNFRFFLY